MTYQTETIQILKHKIRVKGFLP